MRANLGVLLGYLMHALLAAFGVAALVAASPVLFEILRWVGAAYLAYLAINLIRSAIHSGICLSLELLTTRWSGEAFCPPSIGRTQCGKANNINMSDMQFAIAPMMDWTD